MFAKDRVLVVDAGNTSIKFTAFENDQILWTRRDESDLAVIGFIPDAVYLASVLSSEESALLYADIQSQFPKSRCFALSSQSSACGVNNAYVEPSRLGVDRWLGVVAAHHIMTCDAVVVDAGTAIKVDVVDKDGAHLGGYIAPGLVMMEGALLSKTARVRYDANEVVAGQGLPNSTARAVSEGCLEMTLGFLERIHRRYPDCRWVATGGDAQVLLDLLGIPIECQPNLVALGAKLVGDEQRRGNK
ncbi:Baf family transcriptional regulator [Marinomonas ushuaiensis DSM 15871]|uniref:Type III pantothenate kinase n=1 Tax=Marinomonas ushuaiensis DSM 15871 TaxID=1122207 RepID=X7E1X3_9GAMM|nr:type III pantothenate kinase [Marinomonas ushuaiensis]ETX09937.1 Baf family transcriptional regulator [Marinomonas ushuaiensis DSM 15871]